MIPALLLLVGLALAGNYIYLLFSRRSKARYALRDLQQPIRRRQQQVLRLSAELGDQVPALKPRLERLGQLGQAARSEAKGFADEELIRSENELQLYMESLQQSLRADPSVSGHPVWLELDQAWSEVEEKMDSAGLAYNQAVRRYNKGLTGFPGRLTASLLGLEAMPVLRR